MSWNNLPPWDKNRSVFFQIGLVIALSLANIIINYYGTKPDYREYKIDEDNILFSASEVRIHRIAHELPTKEIQVVKRVDQLIAKIVTTNEPILDPVEAVEPALIHDNNVAEDLGVSTESTPEIKIIKSDPNKVLKITENMPYLNSCDALLKEEARRSCTQSTMLEYIYKHLKYPTLARESGIEGTVILSFVIDKTGKLKDLEIIRDIGAGCGAAASKVIKGLSDWTPGYHNDHAVIVKYTIPISFRLNK